MQEAFKIWVARLGEGQVHKIEGSFDPSFLEIDEEELKFRSPIKASGEAYLAERHLVIRLKASTHATLPCAVCNEMMDIPLKVDNFYHTEAVSEIRDALFDLSAPLREALLIQLPNYFECRSGNCPERPKLAPFLRQAKKDGKDTHLPFADL